MYHQLLSANSESNSVSPNRTNRRCGVVALGLLATGAGIGFLGFSTDVLAKSHTLLSENMPNVFASRRFHWRASHSPAAPAATAAPAADCHPFQGRQGKFFVSGYDGGALNKWMSHNDAGHWMIARYDKWSDSAPFLFHQAEQCGEYYLQNKWEGLTATSANDDHWMSFTDCGQWVRSVYTLASAVPIKFIDAGDGTYKMQNVYASLTNPDHQYLSYTDGDNYQCSNPHPAHSVRTTYTESDAMRVHIVWNIEQ